MKFLVTWKLYDGRLHETLAKFAQLSPDDDAALMGDNIKLIGRWHDLIRGEGAAIMEADSAEAISAYLLVWNGDMDVDISVVLDDAECRALGNRIAS